jgi:hypothetical protein
MILKFRTLGIGLVLLVSASFAYIGSAEASELHVASSGNMSVFGEKTATDAATKIEFGEMNAQCTQALYEGTITGSGSGAQTTVNEFTLTPTYTGCTAFGLNATINMNGCKYTVTGAGQPALTAAVDIAGCTTGKSIEVTVTGGCVLTLLQSNGLTHLVFTNNGTHITAQITLGSIQFEAHNCPFYQNTVKTNQSKILSQATFQTRVDTGAQTATHNGHQYNKLATQGALVSVVAT